MTMNSQKFYMNIQTGSVGTYDDWYYENEDGKIINAVDLGEVIEVIKDDAGNWVESKWNRIKLKIKFYARILQS